MQMAQVFTPFDTFRELQGLHLFHAKGSNCSMRVRFLCARVRFLCAEKSLDYVSHLIDIKAQENLHRKYLEIHPNGLVPALVHDGKAVPGSDNILLYLEEQFPNPCFSPSDVTDLNLMKQWVRRAADFQLSAVKPYTYSRNQTVNKAGLPMSIYANLVKDPDLVDFHAHSLVGFDEDVIHMADKRVTESYGDLNDHLSQRDWLAGSQFTLADIAWSTPHLSLGRVGFTLENFPNVNRWYERLKMRSTYLIEMNYMLASGHKEQSKS